MYIYISIIGQTDLSSARRDHSNSNKRSRTRSGGFRLSRGCSIEPVSTQPALPFPLLESVAAEPSASVSPLLSLSTSALSPSPAEQGQPTLGQVSQVQDPQRAGERPRPQPQSGGKLAS